MNATDAQTALDDLESADPADIDVNDLRLDLFDELSAVLAEAYRKSAGDGRIRDTEKAKARQGYINAYIRGANAKIRLLAAIEDAQVSERLEEVEEALDIER